MSLGWPQAVTDTSALIARRIAAALWYYETALPDGSFSPHTAPEPPATCKANGVLRILDSGGQGPRTRHIKRIPARLRALSLRELQAVMPGLTEAVPE